jgi:predicted acylesterase/phospholipase RssA
MSETSAASSPAAAETGIGSQVKFKAGFPGALNAEDINALEQAALLERRRLFADPQQEVNLDNVSGLAFSGGGIRSATFCLGVAQVLQRRGLLHQFDYLSTVSGGGYFGSFLSCYLGTGGPNKGVSRFEEAFDAENCRE